MTPPHGWPVYGHDWAVDYLQKGLIHRRVRHAYLIAGVESVGKTTLANAFAMALNCELDDVTARPCGVCRSCKQTRSGNHPDLLQAQPDEKRDRLLIDGIRDLTRRIAMKPYMSRYRVAILPDFDRVQPIAQDALLKTLEEPPPHAVLVLLVTSLEPVLSTITSRSQIINLRPAPAEAVADVLATHYDIPPDAADELGRFSGGRIGWAIRAAEDPLALDQRIQALDLLESVLNQNRAGRFEIANALAHDHRSDSQALPLLLELWLTFWRDALLLAEEAPVKTVNVDRREQLQQLQYTLDGREALAALQATKAMLDTLKTNANVRLALEAMFLKYPGLPR